MHFWLCNTKAAIRRFVLAFVAIGLSILILHFPLSTALMNRGDGELAAGNQRGALKLYQRAAWFDTNSSDIASRQLFAAYMIGTSDVIVPVLQNTQNVVRQNPSVLALYVDVALCATRIRDRGLAAQSFEHAGYYGHVAEYLVLAGWSWKKIGSTERARRVWHNALKLKPLYPPAVYALKKVGKRS